MSREVRSLLFSSLYPSAVRPGHGIFVETRLRELLRSGSVQAKVVAPVPWFPSTAERFGSYALMARTPRRETRHGIDVLHPRFAVLPKVGMSLAPFSLALAGLRAARRLQAEGFDFDLIDAHYFYPDGVAAALMAHFLGKPLVITARGSDVNVIAGFAAPRRMMLWAARQASACIGVSRALVDVMRQLGMPEEHLHVFRNGVDLARFRPLPQAEARRRIGHEGAPLLLSVGNLVPGKGHATCIEALPQIMAACPEARLLIVGTGPEATRLAEMAARLGLAPRVHLIGAVPNDQLAAWYSAADVLLLASRSEGWPNVLLEAMACGTPVAATRVGGIPEIVAAHQVGRLIDKPDAPALAQAVLDLLRSQPDRAAVRRHAEGFGWADTSLRQEQLFAALAHAEVAAHA
jgi:glycosyltransferase involved in cell wall biosynthesis